jgi:quercetin dioxygenase-like cupin family protein
LQAELAQIAPALAAALADQPQAPPVDLRNRLLERLATSRAAEAAMITVRQRRLATTALAPGVTTQTLYEAQPAAARRPGEPVSACLIRLEAGATLAPAMLGSAASARHREWLLLEGSASLDGQTLSLRDYHVTPAGHTGSTWSTASGALLFLRQSELAAQPGDASFTVRDAEAGWPDFAPGIQRRVLWQREGQAALLYYAQPGAQVPQHTHGHDEECLMVQGELFLDDLLLQSGDYQLAPAGTGHRVTATDTGVVIYAHGDLDLRFVA